VAEPYSIEAADLPEDVVALLEDHLLDLGGSYGDPQAGEPVHYDELRIEHNQGVVEIVVYKPRHLLFRIGRGGEADSPGELPARRPGGSLAAIAVPLQRADDLSHAGWLPQDSADTEAVCLLGRDGVG
jgi:hypothetical protein